MTMTQEAIHTEACVELLGKGDAYANSRVRTIQNLTEQQCEIVYDCPHWAHDIPRQLAHR